MTGPALDKIGQGATQMNVGGVSITTVQRIREDCRGGQELQKTWVVWLEAGGRTRLGSEKETKKEEGGLKKDLTRDLKERTPREMANKRRKHETASGKRVMEGQGVVSPSPIMLFQGKKECFGYYHELIHRNPWRTKILAA